MHKVAEDCLRLYVVHEACLVGGSALVFGYGGFGMELHTDGKGAVGSLDSLDEVKALGMGDASDPQVLGVNCLEALVMP